MICISEYGSGHTCDAEYGHRGQHACQCGIDWAASEVCVRCHQPVHIAAPDADPDAARWYHNEIADDVFCGVVMHAADRVAGR